MTNETQMVTGETPLFPLNYRKFVLPDHEGQRTSGGRSWAGHMVAGQVLEGMGEVMTPSHHNFQVYSAFKGQATLILSRK